MITSVLTALISASVYFGSVNQYESTHVETMSSQYLTIVLITDDAQS